MLKNFAYRLFYRILKHLSETEIPVDSGDFSLMDRRVVDLINRLPEKTRYIRGLRAWVGFKQTGVLVDRPSRHAGAPKYTLYRLILLALSGVISFSVIPLRFATGLGVLVSFLSFASIIVIVAIRLFTTLSIPGFAATASILLFLGGVQLLTVGILGEYVGRIFDEVKGRPLFIVSEALGLENDR
jgi:dolichol-phosphate mannosyltransferase